MSAVLEVNGLTKRFGGLTAVDGVTFSVNKAEILGIIGPNGAGKSTLFNLIAGVHRLNAGTIRLMGQDILGSTPDSVARLGLLRTFQSTTVFRRETVAENIRRGALFGRISRPWMALGTRRGASDELAVAQQVDSVLAMIGLAARADGYAGDLAYGQRKVLGVGIALAGQPSLLLMDEPAAGLNPSETNQMGRLIRRLRDERGVTVVLVEHDMRMVMGLSDRILVLNHGVPIRLGTPEEVSSDPTVIEAYLGGTHDLA